MCGIDLLKKRMPSAKTEIGHPAKVRRTRNVDYNRSWIDLCTLWHLARTSNGTFFDTGIKHHSSSSLLMRNRPLWLKTSRQPDWSSAHGKPNSSHRLCIPYLITAIPDRRYDFPRKRKALLWVVMLTYGTPGAPRINFLVEWDFFNISTFIRRIFHDESRLKWDLAGFSLTSYRNGRMLS